MALQQDFNVKRGIVTGTTANIAGNTFIGGNTSLAGSLTVTNTALFSDTVTISGNLIVSGTTTYVNTATLNVSDNIVTLNADWSGAPTETAGIEVNRGTSANVQLVWDETADYWKASNNTGGFAQVHLGGTGATSVSVGNGNTDFIQQLTLTIDQFGHVNGATTASANIASKLDGRYLSFQSIAVSGQSTVVADAYNDTLTLATSGGGMSITTNATNDTITFGVGVANTSTSGVVTLLDSVSNTSTSSYAPTMNALKTAYDTAIAANTNAAARLARTGDTLSGLLTSRPTVGAMAVATQGTEGIQVASDGASSAAYMTFHRPGSYAVRFGLDTDNVLKVGGWSMGAAAYKIWHSGNMGSTSGLDADTVDGLHIHTGRNNVGNQLVRTDGSGYIQCGYINSDSGNEGNASAPPRIWGTNGSDAYMRTYLASSVSVGSAASATLASTVTINYGNDSNATYSMLWGSGNSVFATGGIYCNPYTDALYTTYDYTYVTYDRDNTGYYSDPSSDSRFNNILTNNISVGYGAGSSSITMYDSDEGSRTVHCNSNQIGFLTQAGGWGAYCDDSGNWTAVGNVTAYSDIRVKKNIKTIDNGLDITKKLRGVFFDRIDTGEASVGVIAQEIEEILPQVVQESQTGNKSVAYGNIVGVLIEAIKELSSEVDRLKEQVNGNQG